MAASDAQQFYGNTFSLLTRAERFLREHLPVAGRVVPDLFERIDDPLYPPVALREALANALCHRDYGMGGGAVAIAWRSRRVVRCTLASRRKTCTGRTLRRHGTP